MFFKSIRFKFLVWYIAALTITLCAFSAILYGGFAKNIYDNLDDLISSKAEGLANSLSAYLQTDEAARARSEGGLNIVPVARDWVEEKRKDPEMMSVFVRILNIKGEPIVSSKQAPAINQIPKDDFDDVLNGEDSFDTVKGQSADGKKEKFRVYTKPVMMLGRAGYVVQAVAPTDLLSIALNNLSIVLFLLVPLMVLLASIPGIFLVRLTLKPVGNMIKTLQQITAENLKLKIHMPDTKDEIKNLADTFNDMIERLDRSFSSQQNFIQDIYYELKTPLGDLKAEFEATLAEKGSLQECEVILRRGLEEANKFSKIIDNLLTLARFDNNQVALEIKKVNLGRIIDEILKEIKTRAAEKDIAISSFLQDTIILDGDGKQLKTLLLNILDNAVKYTYRKGKVTVAAHKHKRYAEVVISDTGSGIPEDELSYIFDRFYRAGGRRAQNGSFGLGLSTAKSIAEAHKGKILVESQPGKGSTFTISLPLSYSA